jgi:hypothetical protein
MDAEWDKSGAVSDTVTLLHAPAEISTAGD